MSRGAVIPVWKRAPFIRLLPPLVAGILFEYFTETDIRFIYTGFLLMVFFIFLLSRKRIDIHFKRTPYYGMALNVLIFLLGVLICRYNDVTKSEQWYGNHLKETDALKIELKTKPVERAKTFKITAVVKTRIHGDSVFSAKGDILCYLYKDPKIQSLQPGDVIIIKNKLSGVRNSGNPGSFDYKTYLSLQQIYHQTFLGKEDWLKTRENNSTFLDVAIRHTLEYIQNVFDKNLKGAREAALSRALLTGDRSALDRDLVQAYANTGVVHIMAISGLHLGLIFVFLKKLLDTIPVLRDKLNLKMILVLAGIWFFAFMTGRSPSVMRAATMFSFLAIGTMQKRKTSTLNFWAAAAFFLLCLNPLLLFHVGFQLSFLAVLGILVAYKPIYRWLSFDNKGVDFLWSIVSVTISAQLFVLPLCIYYFQQFPVLFALVNLVAIPLASIGLWSAMLLVVTGWIPVVSTVFGRITEHTFLLLNKYVVYINSLSFSSWDGLFITKGQTLMIAFVVIFILYWLLYKNKAAFKLSLVSLIGLSVLTGYREIQHKYQAWVIIYNVPQQTAIDFMTGNRFEHFSDRKDGFDDGYQRDIMATRNYYHVFQPSGLTKKYRWNGLLVLERKKSFLMLNDSGMKEQSGPRVKVDYVIVARATGMTVEEMNRRIDAGCYVFTPVSPPREVEKWKKECERLNLRFHDVVSDGALVLEL